MLLVSSPTASAVLLPNAVAVLLNFLQVKQSLAENIAKVNAEMASIGLLMEPTWTGQCASVLGAGNEAHKECAGIFGKLERLEAEA